MKKILVIHGSGRPHGNTAQLIESFVRGAEEAGNSVEIISLNKHEVKGCLGCNACRYGKSCVQKDSFNEIVPKIKGADCIVFASPLYFWTISSKLKAFMIPQNETPRRKGHPVSRVHFHKGRWHTHPPGHVQQAPESPVCGNRSAENLSPAHPPALFRFDAFARRSGQNTVADLAGHGDTSFLERTYCHPQMQLKQDAAKRMINSLFATHNPELLVS